MVETVPSWTDERVELLRRLWEEGLSASQIATQLSGVTRNAVIGKVHRLGLSGRVKPGDAANAGRKKMASREAEAEMPLEDALIAPEVIPIVSHRPAPTFPESAPRADIGPSLIATSTRVTIMDLRESMCRWPMGDPTSADFHYCGDRSITGLPYCTHHAQIAYQPAAERKRDRRVGGFR